MKRGTAERAGATSMLAPRWLAGAALAFAVMVGAFAAAHPGIGAAQEPPSRPEERVVVQYRWGAYAQALVDSPRQGPTLGQQGYAAVTVPKGKTRDQFLQELRANPDVVSAQADAVVTGAAIPNDPYYFANESTYMELANAPAAWDLATGANASIVIAVLDSGLDLAHEEFAGRLWENPRDANNNGADDDGNGCIDDRYGCRFVNTTTDNAAGCGYTSGTPTGAVMDDHGQPGFANHSHGTLVAGIAGAAGNNGTGITGVAWNVRLMTVKVLDCGPFGQEPRGSMFNVAQGIDYAVRMGANIINLSLAASASDPNADQPALRAALQRAHDAGVIVVAAAGNHSGNDSPATGYPAAYTQFSNLVAVGASDFEGNWAPYSNYGASITLAAPGGLPNGPERVAGTARTDIGLAQPYGSQVGTSVATPIVSGMFALMMARNPFLSVDEYVQAAKAAARPATPAPGGQNWAGAGIINIGGAVARIPMSITGSPLKDFRDVPAGTDIRAFVGGNDCGSAKSFTVGVVARYEIRVKSDAEQTGCGAPGRTVQVNVGGQPGSPTFPWGGRDESLGLLSRDVSTVSPPPGAIVVQQLNDSWSNIAFLEPSGEMPSALSSLSSPWNAVLRWDPDKAFLGTFGAYRQFAKNAPGYVNDLPQLQTYDAYWINAASANAASLNPNPAPGRSIALKAGWNNFVYTGSSKSVAEALSQLEGKYSEVLQYDNATRTWLTYLPGRARYFNDFGGLFKLKVYWIYLSAPATLTMN